MKNIILYTVIALLAVSLWFKSCNADRQKLEPISITVPEYKGSFEKTKVEYIPVPKTTVKWNKETFEIKNPVNDSLVEAYRRAKDSIHRFKLYLSAIEEKEFTKTFEDDYLTLDLKGKVRGDLKWIEPNYIIKERDIPAPQKITTFRLLLGGQLENNTSFNDFNYKASLGLQNAQGNILRVGYSKINDLDYFMLGYDISIFSIKK